MQATLVEIAAFFEVSEDTIERRVKRDIWRHICGAL